MTYLETKRLRLLALSPVQLRQCLDAPQQLGAQLGIVLSPMLLGEPLPHVLAEKLDQIGRFPDLPYEWFSSWPLIEQATQQGIGFAGFKGYPRDGMAEIGYGLAATHRNRGYMSETVRALVGWGLARVECTQVIAETKRGNVASERVLQKVGFWLDEETAEFRYWSIA